MLVCHRLAPFNDPITHEFQGGLTAMGDPSALKTTALRAMPWSKTRLSARPRLLNCDEFGLQIGQTAVMT